MADFKFSDANFDDEIARTKAKARAARTAMLAGLVGSLDELSDEGAAAFELQRALARGAQDSQAAELKRLISKHGPEHPYVVAAQARIATLDGLTSDMGELAQGAGHLIETFNEPSVFHGYVLSAAGSAAGGVIVELRLALRENSKTVPARSILRFQGSTDAEGYFKLNLRQPEEAPTEQNPDGKAKKSAGAMHDAAGKSNVDSLSNAFRDMKTLGIENMVRASVDREAVTEEKPEPGRKEKPATAASAAAGDERLNFISDVRILEGGDKGKVLYTDPTPPEFFGQVTNGILELRSQFRLYSLP